MQRRAGGRLAITITVADASAARRVRLLVDGRVARTRTRAFQRFTIELKPRAGMRMLVVEAIDARGKRYRSPRTRVLVANVRRLAPL